MRGKDQDLLLGKGALAAHRVTNVTDERQRRTIQSYVPLRRSGEAPARRPETPPCGETAPTRRRRCRGSPPRCRGCARGWPILSGRCERTCSEKALAGEGGREAAGGGGVKTRIITGLGGTGMKTMSSRSFANARVAKVARVARGPRLKRWRRCTGPEHVL